MNENYTENEQRESAYPNPYVDICTSTYQQYNQGAPTNPHQQPVSGIPEIWNILLMICLPISYILSFFSYFGTMQSINIFDMLYGNPVLSGAEVPSWVPMVNGLCSMISIAVFILFVIDIIVVSRGGYKVLGLVLFFLFFRPGYFIWRANLLAKNKTPYIIYTVFSTLVLLVYLFSTTLYTYRLLFGVQ